MRIRRKSSSRGRMSSWRKCKDIKDMSIRLVSQVRLLMEDRSITTVGHLQGLLLGSPFNEKVLVEQAPGLRPDASVPLGHGLHAVFQQHDSKGSSQWF